MSTTNQQIMDLNPLPVDLDQIKNRIRKARLTNSNEQWLNDLAFRFSYSDSYNWTMPTVLCSEDHADEFLEMHELLARPDELSEVEFNDLLVYYDVYQKYTHSSGFNTPDTKNTAHTFRCDQIKFDGSQCITDNQKIAAQLQINVTEHKCYYLSESSDGKFYLGYKTLPDGQFVKLYTMPELITPIAISDVVVKEVTPHEYPCMKTDEFLNFYRLRFNIIVERYQNSKLETSPLTYSHLIAEIFDEVTPTGAIRAGTSPEYILKKIAA